eukprot:TRINITY_DN989_c1_g2_i2.p1 TRINITY_DN989_c1_g2~~TRINITY_DN989_c1_g2_i2.p1  ORF type:complete len:142 (-),score=14.66 TRINITY_DN989_c1_g2_i2:378-803(-)
MEESQPTESATGKLPLALEPSGQLTKDQKAFPTLGALKANYLADMVCLIYGKPAAFGVVTKPMNIRDGINSFLDGCVEQENVRFRSCALNFKMQTEVYSEYRWPYLKIEKSFGGDSAFPRRRARLGYSKVSLLCLWKVMLF